MNFICATILLLFSTFVVAEDITTVKPWIDMQGRQLFVEIADDSASRRLGLMYREELADDSGLLFIYPQESVLKIWMKNTLIPLDIIFLDSQLRIVNMAKEAQPCKKDPCLRYSSQLPAMYVVEVNAGTASSLGLVPGDTIRFSRYIRYLGSD